MSHRRRRGKFVKKSHKPLYSMMPEMPPLDDDAVGPPVRVFTTCSPGYYGNENSEPEPEPQLQS